MRKGAGRGGGRAVVLHPAAGAVEEGDEAAREIAPVVVLVGGQQRAQLGDPRRQVDRRSRRLPGFDRDAPRQRQRCGPRGLLDGVARTELEHLAHRREVVREPHPPAARGEDRHLAVGDQRVRRERSVQRDVEVDGELIEDQVGRQPRLEISPGVEVGHAPAPAQPGPGRPGEHRRVAAGELRVGRAERVHEPQRVHRAGGLDRFDDADRAERSEPDVVRGQRARIDRRAVEPRLADRLAQVEQRAAGVGTDGVGDGRVDLGARGRAVERDGCVKVAEVDRHRLQPVDGGRRRRQAEVRGRHRRVSPAR